MKEIRFHGRGGQGIVKGAQILVKSMVRSGRYANFMPFFGVEKKGSPVFGFMRINNNPIRLKCQVYQPHCLLVLDDSLLNDPRIFSGLREKGILILNSNKSINKLNLSSNVKTLGIIDASQIAIKYLNVNIPNTAILGAFAKVTQWIDISILLEEINNIFGEKNSKAALESFNKTKIIQY